MLSGSSQSPILVIMDKQDVMAKAENLPIAGENRQLVEQAFMRAGVALDDVSFCLLSDIEIIKSHEAKVLIPFGEICLQRICAVSGIMKWWGSVIHSTAEFAARKAIPAIHPDNIRKEYTLSAYLQLTCVKAKAEMNTFILETPVRKFLINASFQEAMEYLERAIHAPLVGIDIETGQGLINTFGVAINKQDAMALRMEHEKWTPEEHFALWNKIKELIEGPTPKTYQNHIYETLYFSRYGIRTSGVFSDTMWMMKFLYPEFDKGLDNVGRFFTPFAYWKDDRDDWNNVRDWDSHLIYNGKDTTGTLWAHYEMDAELERRGLKDLFYNYVMKLSPLVIEFCSNGLPVDEVHKNKLYRDCLDKIEHEQNLINSVTRERIGKEINIRSPKQLQNALKEMGIKLPTKTNKKTGNSGETADKKALIKLARKYPKEEIIGSLIRISAQNKMVSSYVDFDYDRETKKVHYTFDGCSTETFRMASYTDPWGRGFNAQTVPKNLRRMFQALPGHTLMQIDLSQAESRYVAYESPDVKLIELLTKKEDIHTYVASRIFNKPTELIGKNSQERQLGKKSGHAANYGVGPRTFAESCLVENNLVITEQEARRIINGYFGVFPGIRKRQMRIQQELRRTKKLVTPLGFERFFYNRLSDACFREAYAFAPQSTIPAIMNHLILFLWNEFPELKFCAQGHDSALMQVPEEIASKVNEAAHQYDLWHPKIELPGGTLLIPIDVEVGQFWHPMSKV